MEVKLFSFKTVFDFGLPELIQVKQLDDEILIKCFLAIAANNHDTNILYRSNPEVLNTFKNRLIVINLFFIIFFFLAHKGHLLIYFLS